MGIPIGELQQRMSSREFAEYVAYAQLEPFGPEREDLRSGVVASTIANVNRDPKRRRQPFTPEQFVLRFEPPPGFDADAEGEDAEPIEIDQGALARRIGLVMMALGGVEPGEA